MKTFLTARSNRYSPIFSLEDLFFFLFICRSYFKQVTQVSASELIKQSKFSPVLETLDPWEVKENARLGSGFASVLDSSFEVLLCNKQPPNLSLQNKHLSLTLHISCGSEALLQIVGSSPVSSLWNQAEGTTSIWLVHGGLMVEGQNKRSARSFQWL